MGQRFLISRPVLTKIIAAADLSREDTVLEIGPGTGILTRALAEKAGRVIAVEKDKRLFELLSEQLKKEGISNVRLISGDILHIPSPYTLTPSPYKVVANIPYYLTSRLIRRLLEAEHPPKDILIMVQKEVAERITARPPHMNLLALSVQAYGQPRILARVPPEAFSPPPKVESALIEITGISGDFFTKHRIAPERFFALAKAAFAGKRKILANSLARTLDGKEHARALIKKSGLADRARPEELSLEDWAKLIQNHDR